jgi:hypothetical protein
MFLLDDILNAESELRETSYKFVSDNGLESEEEEKPKTKTPTLGDIFGANVKHSIVQSSSHQEFQAEIVDSL